MSEPRRYFLNLRGGDQTADWHNDPATPKQLARLRYLGLAPRVSVTKGQAGALIDRSEVESGFSQAVAQWHREKYRLHPDLYPPPMRDREDARLWQEFFGKDNIYHLEFRRPTQLQIIQILEYLDRSDPGWDQGHDYLRSEQRFMSELARTLPALRKRNCSFPQAPSLLGKPNEPPPLPALSAGWPLAARSPNSHAEFPAPSSPERRSYIIPLVLTLAAVFMVGASLEMRFDAPPANSESELRPVRPVNATPSPVPVPFRPPPAATPSPLRAEELAKAVAQAQREAIIKYPSLRIANTEMNSRFVFRYKRLLADQSIRLHDPNWPLQLADECAATSGLQSH